MPALIAGTFTVRAPSPAATVRAERYADASCSRSPCPPPAQAGPTAWTTQRAGRPPAPVATAGPGGVPAGYLARSSAVIAGPPARWIAPSTPPPPLSALLAALTMASAANAVMSPTTRARTAAPSERSARGGGMVPSCPARRRPAPGPNDMAPPPPADEIQGCFAGRLAEGWFVGPPEVHVDREEILVIGELADVELGKDASDAARAAARQARTDAFRRETREPRMRTADDPQLGFGRAVSWGVRIGGTERLFTTLALPVMTRLRMAERRTLDTLVAAGGARGRAGAGGRAYGEDGPKMKTGWNIPPVGDALYAGVDSAGLFRSDDRGETWQHVEGLTNHPTRPTWEGGFGGLCLHSIVPHPTDPRRMWVAISAVGTFAPEDGGGAWGAPHSGGRAGV